MEEFGAGERGRECNSVTDLNVASLADVSDNFFILMDCIIMNNNLIDLIDLYCILEKGCTFQTINCSETPNTEK